MVRRRERTGTLTNTPQSYVRTAETNVTQTTPRRILEIRNLAIEGVKEILTPKFGDHRGFFSETWNRPSLQAAGVDFDFIQDNHSLSSAPGTIRGLHYQMPPFAQTKLVRVIRGAIFDVAVDIRRGSPTYAQWVGIEISSDLWNQILVPAGFAHGFITLTPDTEVIYKVDAQYAPSHDRSIRYNDPDIGINWPTDLLPFHLSEKDQNAPFLSETDTGFIY